MNKILFNKYVTKYIIPKIYESFIINIINFNYNILTNYWTHIVYFLYTLFIFLFNIVAILYCSIFVFMIYFRHNKYLIRLCKIFMILNKCIIILLGIKIIILGYYYPPSFYYIPYFIYLFIFELENIIPHLYLNHKITKKRKISFLFILVMIFKSIINCSSITIYTLYYYYVCVTFRNLFSLIYKKKSSYINIFIYNIVHPLLIIYIIFTTKIVSYSLFIDLLLLYIIVYLILYDIIKKIIYYYL